MSTCNELFQFKPLGQKVEALVTRTSNNQEWWTGRVGLQRCKDEKKAKRTYNRGCSLVVIYLTTNPPVRCLNTPKRTGSLVFSWPFTTKSFTLPYPVVLRQKTGCQRS